MKIPQKPIQVEYFLARCLQYLILKPSAKKETSRVLFIR